MPGWADEEAIADLRLALDLSYDEDISPTMRPRTEHHRPGAAHLERMDEALATFREALTVNREDEDGDGEADTLSNMAALYQAQGRFDEAADSLDQALAAARANGTTVGSRWSMPASAAYFSIRAACERRKAPLMRRWPFPARAVPCGRLAGAHRLGLMGQPRGAAPRRWRATGRRWRSPTTYGRRSWSARCGPHPGGRRIRVTQERR
jgi:tetratricopeptide (TPR) repeat protein